MTADANQMDEYRCCFLSHPRVADTKIKFTYSLECGGSTWKGNEIRNEEALISMAFLCSQIIIHRRTFPSFQNVREEWSIQYERAIPFTFPCEIPLRAAKKKKKRDNFGESIIVMRCCDIYVYACTVRCHRTRTLSFAQIVRRRIAYSVYPLHGGCTHIAMSCVYCGQLVREPFPCVWVGVRWSTIHDPIIWGSCIAPPNISIINPSKAAIVHSMSHRRGRRTYSISFFLFFRSFFLSFSFPRDGDFKICASNHVHATSTMRNRKSHAIKYRYMVQMLQPYIMARCSLLECRFLIYHSAKFAISTHWDSSRPLPSLSATSNKYVMNECVLCVCVRAEKS